MFNKDFQKEYSKENEAKYAFRKAVDKLKSMCPDDFTRVHHLTDKHILRAVAAWPHVPREIKENAVEYDNPWDMIWYAPGVWMDAAGIPKCMEKALMLAIRQNNLVYPDGSIPADVYAYLCKRGKELAGIKDGDDVIRHNDVFGELN